MSEVFVKFTLSQYLRPGSHKIAISLPDLVTQTNNFSTKNRPGCTPSLQGSDPKDLFLKYNVKCNLKTSDPAGHQVRVHFDVSKVTPEVKANDLDIRVSCSCPAFLYWGAQWNLHQKDGLEGQARPQLQAPTERLDLRKDFVICKHCKSVFERILPAVQHNIVKLVREKEVKERTQKTPEVTPDRLLREQDAMKKRLEIKDKRKTKNKEVEEELLKGLRKRDEVRLQQKDQDEQENPGDDIVERTEPATEEPKKEAPALKPEKPMQTYLERKKQQEEQKKRFRDFTEKKMKRTSLEVE